MDALKNSVIQYERLLYSTDWKPWLAQQLAGYDVLTPSMPNKQNANFDEWSIYFEKLMPFFSDNVQLVGHSLGAMFLAKYLSQNPLNKKVRRIILVAGGYDDSTREDLGSFGLNSIGKLTDSSDDIHLLHSKDDLVVPFSELAKYQKELPGAAVHIFNGKSHFFDPEFPELLEILKQK